jgi:thiol-disulfide isomerase/thioredoxin
MLPLLLTALSMLLAGEPFLDLGFEDAKARAAAEKKLLLVDFRADWCGPCKKMEKETWVDPTVRAWLAENALAIQIDVDHDRDLPARFSISGIPAVIALVDGEEKDRSVGYKGPADFLAWAKDVRAGKSSAERLLERARDVGASEDVDARYDLARDLLQAGKHAEALEQYLWLWPATREVPAMGGVRMSFMLSDMARLAQSHPPAMQAFLGILLDLGKRVEAAEVPSHADWDEWTSFCQYFGREEQVLAWYEKHRDEQGRLFAEREDGFQGGRIRGDVFEVLMRARRPLDAVRLYEDGRARAKQIAEDFEQRRKVDASLGLEDELHASVQRSAEQSVMQDLSSFHAALLAAGRREEATAAAQELLRVLDTPASRIALVRHALELVETPEPDFARWLDEAEAAGGKVRALRRKLDKLAKRTASEPR